MLRVPPEQHILKFLMTAASNKTAANDFGSMFDLRPSSMGGSSEPSAFAVF
jgi:hypothetical protein